MLVKIWLSIQLKIKKNIHITQPGRDMTNYMSCKNIRTSNSEFQTAACSVFTSEHSDFLSKQQLIDWVQMQLPRQYLFFPPFFSITASPVLGSTAQRSKSPPPHLGAQESIVNPKRTWDIHESRKKPTSCRTSCTHSRRFRCSPTRRASP
jgi:hypothetical protein